ncbi:MAG: hypothetical protein ABI333_01790 [bacterium]
MANLHCKGCDTPRGAARQFVDTPLVRQVTAGLKLPQCNPSLDATSSRERGDG